jgi:hypothetical protein
MNIENFTELIQKNPELLSKDDRENLISEIQDTINVLEKKYHQMNFILLLQVLLLIVSTNFFVHSITGYITVGIIVGSIIMFSILSYKSHPPKILTDYLIYLKNI